VTDLERIAGRAWRTPPVVTLLALLWLWLRGGLSDAREGRADG